ncbi:MAG: GNAT family N-acetyltransferase [Bacteroidales bacterium]
MTKLQEIIKIMNNDYPIPLVEKIDLNEYSQRILKNGHVVVCKKDSRIVAFVTFYANKHEEKEAAFSLLGVLKQFRKHDIASKLFEISYDIMKSKGMETVFSYTHKENAVAIKFHLKMGFIIDEKRSTNQPYNISFIRKL